MCKKGCIIQKISFPIPWRLAHLMQGMLHFPNLSYEHQESYKLLLKQLQGLETQMEILCWMIWALSGLINNDAYLTNYTLKKRSTWNTLFSIYVVKRLKLTSMMTHFHVRGSHFVHTHTQKKKSKKEKWPNNGSWLFIILLINE